MISRRLLLPLEERGKIAIARSVSTSDERKRVRYREEAQGYADLVALMLNLRVRFYRTKCGHLVFPRNGQ